MQPSETLPSVQWPIVMPYYTLDSLYLANTEKVRRREHESWIMRKLRHENQLDVEQGDFIMTGGITFNFEVGEDRAHQFEGRKYVNSRGYHFSGAIGQKFFFKTTFYENQAILPNYMDSVVNERTSVPGYGRIKNFNTQASFNYNFDYTAATGVVGFALGKRSFIMAGHDRHFVGHGHRSLFVSDAAVPFPFVRGQFSVLDGKLSYSNTMSMRQVQERVAPNYNFKEAMFKRFYWKFSVLEFQPKKWLSLSWYASSPVVGKYPLTFLPSLALVQDGVDDLPILQGLNARVVIAQKAVVYGQLATNNSDMGYQVGVKGVELWRPAHLNVLVEYNSLPMNLYNSSKATSGGPEQYNYSHFNQPIGHNLGDGVDEFVVKASTRFRDFFLSGEFTQAVRFDSPLLPIRSSTMFITEVGYIINTKSNAMMAVGVVNRDLNSSIGGMHTNYVYLSFRTQMLNRFIDY